MGANIRGSEVKYDSSWETDKLWEAIEDLRQEHLEIQGLVEQMIEVFQSLVKGHQSLGGEGEVKEGD